MAKQRNARIGIELNASRLNPGINDARKRLRSFAADTKRTLGSSALGLGKKTLGGVGKGMAGFGKGLAAGVGFGALAGVEGMVRGVFDLEKAMTRFQIAGSQTPEQMEAFRAELTKVSNASGVAKTELLAGAAAYVALTGDAAGAAQSAALFAKVANATGASMEDISSTAAALKENLKIDPKDFEAAFSALHTQGKVGAVELRELATELAGIAPTFAQFAGGTGAGGVAQLGSALQVVRKGFGSSSEAATGLQSLMVSINKNAGKFAKAGVQVFTKNPKTGKKELKGFYEIVQAIADSKLAKDPTALSKAFGRDEAKRAFDQLVQNKAQLDTLMKASQDAGAIQRDAATFQQSSAGKLAKVFETLKNSIAEAFTPERIEAFVNGMSRLAEIAGKALGAFEGLMDVGASIRGFVDPESMGHKSMGGAVDMLGGGWDDAEAAKIQRYNDTVDQIIAKTQGGKVTPESIQTALQAKWAPDVGKGQTGAAAREAGSSFLQTAGYQDPYEQIRKLETKLGGISAGSRIKQAVELSLKLAIDGKEIQAVISKSKGHRTRPGGQ